MSYWSCKGNGLRSCTLSHYIDHVMQLLDYCEAGGGVGVVCVLLYGIIQSFILYFNRIVDVDFGLYSYSHQQRYDILRIKSDFFSENNVAWLRCKCGTVIPHLHRVLL